MYRLIKSYVYHVAAKWWQVPLNGVDVLSYSSVNVILSK